MTLLSGERQVAPTIDGIRADHAARYHWAAGILPEGSSILDVGCGVGYGAHILAEAGHKVLAIDTDAETIAYAKVHYGHPNIMFECMKAEGIATGQLGRFQVATCFEVVEHIADPATVLTALGKISEVVLASVPNEDVFPFKNYAFHHRHYRKGEFLDLLTESGLSVESWWGQLGPQSEVEPDVNGRTLVAVARSSPVSMPAAKKAPEHVTIVGLGPSCATFFELTRRLGGVSAYCDEVWGINAIGDVLRCDRVFHLDDLLIQERRAAADPTSNIAAMVKWLKHHPGPVYTSVVREGYPGLVAFPLEEVLNGGHDSDGAPPYFNSTAAYAIAFAIHIGVKKISLYGLDYTLPNSHQAEQGRSCCEFWLGIAAARGIEIMVPHTSSMLDACQTDRERLYGYDCVDIRLVAGPEGGVKVQMTDRADIPTAEEIEARYSRKPHPNPLMRK